jgi:hypothetical protein
MGLKDVLIKLDNSNNTYYAGQTVNGQVVFEFDSPKKIRGIKVQFLGAAITKWYETEKRETSDGKTEEEQKEVSGKEEYFQISYYLLGGANASETELPAGTHSYPFSCVLPPTLPSSFEGEHGHVRYTVTVTLDRPWKFDQETKMAFTVISPVDLNKIESVRKPHRLEMEKSFCCFCCASGPLSVVVSLPVTGYVSGQTIPLLADIDNGSNVDIVKMKFIFIKSTAYHTQSPRLTKRDEQVIAELGVGPFNRHETRNVKQSLDIPPLPPSNLDNCGIIDLVYELRVICEVSGFHTNLSGIIPITLGTVPLLDYQPPASQSTAIDVSMLPTQPVSPETDNIGGAIGWNVDNPLPNIPPPTFSEADFKAPLREKGDSEFIRLVGNQEFAPKYPTYTAFQPTAPQMD